MKTKKWMATLLVALLALFTSMPTQAQVKDQYLTGVWTLELIKRPDGDVFPQGYATGYLRIKIFGADGEYCCAQIRMRDDKNVMIIPHEYGKYTYDGKFYSEMGRAPLPVSEAVIKKDKNTFGGYFMKTYEQWKRRKDIPKAVIDEVMRLCNPSSAMDKSMQKQMMDCFFKK